MTPEKAFENRVKNWLKGVGIYSLGTEPQHMAVPPIGYFEKRWGGGKFVKAGLPDLHIVANGINLDVELKAAAGRPTELQRFMIRQINDSGSIALVLYPDGFPAFQNLITEVIKCSSHIPALNAMKAALSSFS